MQFMHESAPYFLSIHPCCLPRQGHQPTTFGCFAEGATADVFRTIVLEPGAEMSRAARVTLVRSARSKNVQLIFDHGDSRGFDPET